ncbi:hypothetical protein KIPB_005082 [Kipferlia bialata]|uniref:Lipid-binding serum glycoprotein C-terminal domain-containing protein n=1 Tax=Kipferlia bialata TaxID=797122 RepID=A0A9K3CWH9_9EUKA|nr:hypothetical protein KIPB_005082 [Kipferlia bialata]|eukprot:g5082.t1
MHYLPVLLCLCAWVCMTVAECPPEGEADPSDIGAVVVLSIEGVNKLAADSIPDIEASAFDLKMDDINTSLDLGITVVDLSITQLLFANFHIGDIKATSLPLTQELMLNMDDLDLELTFDWEYTEESWPFSKDSGTGTATCTGIGGEVVMGVGFDHVCGVPQFMADSVNLDLGDIKITLDGGASQLFQLILNAFIGLVEDLFTDELNTLIAASMTEAINEGIQESTGPSNVPDGMKEDFRSPNPVVVLEDNYIAIHFTAYIYPADEGPTWSARDAIMPTPLPNLVTSEDLQFVLSNTLFESLFLSSLHLGLLKGQVDPAKVQDPQLASLLTTTSLGAICPGLYEAYPDATVTLDLDATEMPTVTVMPSALFSNVTGTVHVSVHDEASQSMVDTFTVGYSVGLAGTPQSLTETLHNAENMTTFYIDYTPYNTTGWEIESSYGPVDMEGPSAMMLQMYLSFLGVVPWFSDWTLRHSPNFGIAGDFYDWQNMYSVLEPPGAIVYNVAMMQDLPV